MALKTFGTIPPVLALAGTVRGKAYKTSSLLSHRAWAGSSAWLERGAFNPVAAGSNPVRPASNTNFAYAKFDQGLYALIMCLILTRFSHLYILV